MLDRSGRPKQLADGDIRKNHGVDVLYQIINRLPEAREPFWKTFVEVGKKNPGALRQVVTMMAIYLHLGPFSKHVISEIDRRIAELDAAVADARSGRLSRAGGGDGVSSISLLAAAANPLHRLTFWRFAGLRWDRASLLRWRSDWA